MKKLISIICVLGVLCGMTSAMAAGTLSVDDTSFLSGDYMTVQEEVLANGDHVGITINADGISDVSKFETSCDDFSAFKVVLEYDPAVLEVDPYGNADGTAFYDLTTFQAVYGGRAPKIPTADTDGIISTANAHTIVEVNTPGQIGMSIANGTKFFSVNGDFLTIYFTVLDKDAEAEVNVKLLQAVDKTPANIPVDTLVAESLSVKVAGMGAPVVEKTLTATVDEEIVEVVAPSGKTTYGISGVVSGGALFNTLVVTVNDNTNGREGTVDFEIGTAIDANDITFGLNIWGAPAGIDFSATAAASLN